jgi:cold-inducible RNA-binding protein
MASRLFIGNLSFNVADAQLNELFAELNIQIENIRLMRDQTTGRSRGFAFAELAPGVDMAAAITQLNGKVLDGRPLTVNEARPQAQREFRPRGGGRPGTPETGEARRSLLARSFHKVSQTAKVPQAEAMGPAIC